MTSPFFDNFTEGVNTALDAHTPDGVAGGTWEYVVLINSLDLTVRGGNQLTAEVSAVFRPRIDLTIGIAPFDFVAFADLQRNNDVGGIQFGLMLYKDSTRPPDETNTVQVLLDRVSASLVNLVVQVIDTTPTIIQSATIELSVGWVSGQSRRLEVEIDENLFLTTRVADAGTGANPTTGGSLQLNALAWIATADQVGLILAGDGAARNQCTLWQVAFAEAAGGNTAAPIIRDLTAPSTFGATKAPC